MKKNFKTILLILLVLVVGYLIWSSTNKGIAQQPIFKIDVVESYGDSTGKGNVLGVQAFMTPIDYASEANFRQKIEFYLIEAKKNKWLRLTPLSHTKRGKGGRRIWFFLELESRRI